MDFGELPRNFRSAFFWPGTMNICCLQTRGIPPFRLIRRRRVFSSFGGLRQRRFGTPFAVRHLVETLAPPAPPFYQSAKFDGEWQPELRACRFPKGHGIVPNEIRQEPSFRVFQIEVLLGLRI